MFHFHSTPSPWKRQKTTDFLTFLWGTEMIHWLEMSSGPCQKYSIKSLYEIIYQLSVVNYYPTKAPLEMFEKVLITFLYQTETTQLNCTWKQLTYFYLMRVIAYTFSVWCPLDVYKYLNKLAAFSCKTV